MCALIDSQPPLLARSAAGELTYVASFADGHDVDRCWEDSEFQDLDARLAAVAEMIPAKALHDASASYMDLEAVERMAPSAEPAPQAGHSATTYRCESRSCSDFCHSHVETTAHRHSYALDGAFPQAVVSWSPFLNLWRRAMGWNDHIDTELNDLLDELTAEGYVLDGTPAFDVARKVATQGKASLTAPEQSVFQSEVVPAIRALALDRERPEEEGPLTTVTRGPTMADRDTSRQANMTTILRQLAWECDDLLSGKTLLHVQSPSRGD